MVQPLADVALLLIDAKEGLQEQTRKHAHIISLLGIKNVTVLVIDYDR